MLRQHTAPHTMSANRLAFLNKYQISKHRRKMMVILSHAVSNHRIRTHTVTDLDNGRERQDDVQPNSQAIHHATTAVSKSNGREDRQSVGSERA